MKALPTSLSIDNFLGVSKARIKLPGVTFVAGTNAAGKSSVADAMRYIMTGDSERVRLKKDQGELVREGARAAEVSIGIEGTAPMTVKLTKTGKTDGIRPFKSGLLSSVCMRPATFTEMQPSERREFLTKLMGLEMRGETAEQALKDRGVPQSIISPLMPYLAGGFSSAYEEAINTTRQLRSDWKAVTGEPYGTEKGGEWKPPALEPQPLSNDVRAIIAKLDRDIAAETTLMAQERVKVLLDADRLVAMRELAVNADESERSLLEMGRQHASTSARAGEIRDALDRAPMVCPCCNAALRAGSDGKLHEAETVNQDSLITELAAVQAKLRELETKQRELTTRWHEERDAKQALERAQSIGIRDEAVIAQSQSRLAGLTSDKDEVYAQLRASMQFENDTASAERREKQATEIHAQILEWTKATDLLSPDGIAAEVLVAALKKLNAELEKSSDLAEFPAVSIHPDAEVRIAGRRLRMCSESERWRAEAVIAVEIARLGGFPIVLLDRFDVLSVQDRGPALTWAMNIAKERADSLRILIFATLKGPASIEDPSVECVWLTDGSTS